MTRLSEGLARPVVLVRGLGDVASAVAHRLFLEGWPVALHQGEAPPLVHRRAMAFADAWFDGEAWLAGLCARRLAPRETPDAFVASREAIVLLPGTFEAALTALGPTVLIDARLRKRARPECQRGLAPLVLGLGPGFRAGGNVDWAVETGWGERLGAILRRGGTAPLAGEPRPLGGAGRERLVYAPLAGRFQALRRIGEPVTAGERVAEIAGQAIAAPLSGTLRGILRDGLAVAAGTKLLEVDPRPPGRATVSGIGERPGRIAASVAKDLAAWAAAPGSDPAPPHLTAG